MPGGNLRYHDCPYLFLEGLLEGQAFFFLAPTPSASQAGDQQLEFTFDNQNSSFGPSRTGKDI